MCRVPCTAPVYPQTFVYRKNPAGAPEFDEALEGWGLNNGSIKSLSRLSAPTTTLLQSFGTYQEAAIVPRQTEAAAPAPVRQAQGAGPSKKAQKKARQAAAKAKEAAEGADKGKGKGKGKGKARTSLNQEVGESWTYSGYKASAPASNAVPMHEDTDGGVAPPPTNKASSTATIKIRLKKREKKATSSARK